MFSIAIPTMASQLILLANEAVCLIFIGHVGSFYMVAGVGLGTTYVNVLA